MADLKSKSPGAKRKAASPARAQRASEKDKAKPKLARSAYLQAKMDVSTPGDPQEQEADRVADEISRMPKGVARKAIEEEGVAPGSSGPESNPADEQSIQTKISRQAEKPEASRASSEPETPVNPLMRATEEKAQTRLARAEEEEAQTKLCRAEEEEAQPKLARAEEEEAQTRLARQEEEEAQTKLARSSLSRQDENEPATTDSEQADATAPQTDNSDKPTVSDEAEQKIEALRGQGEPLADEVRQEMEEKMGADFSNVNIHQGSEADELCKQLQARAFTVGNDIFFASGEYAPESENGRKLLSHELTHVVQQSGSIERKVYREVTPAPAITGGADAQTKLDDLSRLELPPIKHRHAALYTGHGARRAAGYRRNTSEEQVNVWKRDVNLTEDTIAEKIRTQLRQQDPDADFTIPTSPYAQVSFRLPSRPQPISGQWRGIRNQVIIPDWDRRGTYLNDRSTKFQVDHMIELQVFGDTTGNAGNVVGNLELLKGSPNASSGSSIKTKIYEKVYAFLGAQDPNFANLSSDTRAQRRRTFLSQHTLTFTEMVRGEGRAGTDTDWWTRAEIESGDHLDVIQPVPPQQLAGSSGNFLLASGPGGVEIRRYRYSDLANVTPRNRAAREALAGVTITSFALNSQVEQGVEGAEVGTLHGTWNLPNGFRAGEAVDIPLIGVGPYCAAPGQIPGLNTDFSHLSPVEFTVPEIRNGQIYAEGSIAPSIPLFNNTQISAVLEGTDLRFEIAYSPGQLSLPIPGLTIEDSTIALFYSTREGFGGEGGVEFAVDKLGAGQLTIAASQRNGFSASGGFDFDSDLFDRAHIEVWYREGQFGGSGEIGIDQPGKIKGIRSANLSVSFAENEFSATGDVQPEIPGVEQAGLTVSYSEEEGLTIGGNLQLNSDTPGIESGSIDVTLNKQDEGWKVAATGTAVPSIPGINSELTISYNDGAFTAEVTADYSRGMLSGEVNAGVTNRSVGEDGQLSETAEEGNPLVVYGGGSLTLQLTPWLQGTAGVQFAPNGEITVTGEIGLPSELEIFPRYEVDRRLFNVAVQYPIVPAVVAEIGGNLTAVAGIGPGTLNELSLGITYNPDHEEDTTITGDASLRVPADAGLRLAIRAGVGVGVPGASVTGGLEITGTLGLEAAAEASVHVEWSPSAGLDFRANLEAHVQPVFTFGIGGYVSARVLGFSVYDESWELASYSYGPDMRFGLELPIHYHEGEPFDISYDDIVWTIPDVSTSDLLSGLMDRIT